MKRNYKVHWRTIDSIIVNVDVAQWGSVFRRSYTAGDTRDHGNRQIQAEYKNKAVRQIVGTILYYFVQFICHASHLISENPCDNFFSILAEFGDLSEK
jgi:hypothetical protein